MNTTPTPRPCGLIRKGERINIKPEWRDDGDENYQWFAIEDETENGYLKVRARDNQGDWGLGHMSVQSHMVERYPTDQEIIAALKSLAFIVETVAHLQGRECDLLPAADKAREIIDRMEGGQPCEP